MAGWSPEKVKRIVDGDYSKDVDLEHGTQSDKFYENQAKLPRLPIPDLQETLDLYLRTCQPLATAQELEHTKAVTASFRAPGGLGETLYKRLQEHAALWTHSSWLQKWWNQIGYLQWRDPNVINLNYFFHFAEDIGLPVPTSHKNAAELGLQTLAAARMLTGILEFRERLIAGIEPPEMAGKSGQCATMWKYLFNNCRVPAPDQDVFHLYNPTLPGANTVVVLRHNKYYSFSICHPDGRRLSTAEIAAQLQQVIVKSGDDYDLNVGVLTSDNRDNWLKARNQLIADGNEASLEAIQQAILLVCLDDASPVSRVDIARKLWHGESSCKNNRWFDKTITIIAFKNGKMGCNIEHCCFDGSPTRHLMCSVLQSLREGKVNHGGAEVSKALPPLNQITFKLTATSVTMIRGASERFDQWCDIHDVDVLAFQGFGAEAAKKFKCSPDAFAQMAIQLAYYRFFGCQRGTYESSAVRSFLHGRTETTRSVSTESAEWVASMQDPKVPLKTRHELFIKSINAHSDYLKKAGAGKGVDRLLWGLKLCLKSGEKHAFFDDPLFSRSKTWHVSTSHLAHELVDGWGFGEVVPDGVGVGYSVKGNMMQFNVSCQNKEGRWSQGMTESIDQALMDLKALCEAAEKGFQ